MRFERDLTVAPPVAPHLAGLRLRDCVGIDPEARARAHRAAWSALEHIGISADSTFSANDYLSLTTGGAYDPCFYIVAEAADGRLAATAWADRAGGVAVFEPVGVDPEFRGGGPAQSARRHDTLQHLRHRGLRQGVRPRRLDIDLVATTLTRDPTSSSVSGNHRECAIGDRPARGAMFAHRPKKGEAMRIRSRRHGLGLLLFCAVATLPAPPAGAATPSAVSSAANPAASSANVRLVKGFYDASGRGDAAGALAMLSPGIVWNEAEGGPLADRDPYVGPGAVVEGVFGRIGAHFDNFSVEVDDLLDAGDTVVMLGRYHGVDKETGKTLNAQVVHVWTIADGKLAKFQQYTDTLQWTQVMKP
jgi:ketosteroid isomerase-like protein